MASSTGRLIHHNGWKRLSSAASFSIYCRYSSSVVAPNTVQLASCQHGFQHIARIHGAVRLSRSHDGVQFIDKQDDPAFRCSSLLQGPLSGRSSNSPAVLCTSHESAHIKRKDRLLLQSLGTSPLTILCASPSTTAVLPTPALR